jgi:hypothetical protein
MNRVDEATLRDAVWMAVHLPYLVSWGVLLRYLGACIRLYSLRSPSPFGSRPCRVTIRGAALMT